MAGIGFELKKLFSDDNTTFDDIKAMAYSTLIGVGPWFITVITLNILMFIGKEYIPSRGDRNMFMTAIVYGFIFSQIFTGILQYFVTKFISDCIYAGEHKKLRATYIGSIKITIAGSFILGVIFLKLLPLSMMFKIAFIILFCFLSGIWVSMNFISVSKNYTYSILSYLIGNIIFIILGVYILKYSTNEFLKKDIACSIVTAYSIGVGVTFIMLYVYLNSIFEKNNESEFEFLKSFKRYYALCFIGFVFNLGMWSHIFLNWIFGNSYRVKGAFLAEPLYEVAVFYSFFITIPTMVYFLVFMETKFFPVYKKYYALLTLSGNLSEIDSEKKRMMETLKTEIYYIMELQFFLSFSITLLAKTIFLKYAMDLYLLDLFRIMIFGAYSTVFVSIYITVFLYFDARKEALIASLIFFILNTGLTYISFFLGDSYLGLGFFLGSFITLIVCEVILNKIGKKLNYVTFYKQNFGFNIQAPILEKIELFLNKKVLFSAIVILILMLTGCANHDIRGFNLKTRRNWHTMSYYDKNGYDIDGYNSEGVNERGFDKKGWNRFTNTAYDYNGFSVDGLNKETNKKIDERGFNYKGFNEETNSEYDKNGFNFQGIHRVTKTEYDENGWTWYGLNKYTQTYYDKDGFNKEGYDQQGYNRDGYDEKGYNRKGYNKNGYNEMGEKYDPNAPQSEGEEDIVYDKDGFDKHGYNEEGVDRDGFNKQGVFVGDE